MTTAATRHEQYSASSAAQPALYLAFELGETKWKLGFTTGLGQSPRERTIPARDLTRLASEVARAKQRVGLAERAGVVSCYEAGRDGFWLHRHLVQQGITNVVVDSSSIEVNRRARRAKSDGLDVRKLLPMLLRYQAGDRRVWHIVRVPSAVDEDRRQLHRELVSLKRDRTRVTNRIAGLLATQGIGLARTRDFLTRLARVRLWDGSALPAGLRARLERAWQQVELVTAQIRVLEGERREALRSSPAPAVARVRRLLELRAIGPESAWLYAMEFFAWRRFRNGREVGALAGLVPTPYQSGATGREQGIAKAGNRHVRALAIEIAWLWRRLQPRSALSQWYERRFGQGSSRLKRIGIVALARKLLIALWRYLETGVVPEGAMLKT